MPALPKISVALCTYNGEKYLPEQLESIERQTLPPFEIVVCDDGSTDSTLSILRAFREKTSIPVHIYSNEERLGVTRNFKKAIGLCSGDYIALCDQDDVWLNEKLAKEAAFLLQPRNRNISVVFSDLLIVDENLNSLGKTLWQHLNFNKKLQKKWKRGKALQLLSLYGNQVTGSTILLRSSFRPFIEEILTLTGKIWIHDGLIAIAAARQNAISFIDEVTVLYRQHSGQAVGGGLGIKVPLKTRIKKLRTQQFDVIKEIDNRLTAYKHHKEDLLQLGFTEKSLSYMNPVINHFTVRRNLPAKRSQRILPIFKEWIRLRYLKYSRSVFMQAIKDWLLRKTMILA